MELQTSWDAPCPMCQRYWPVEYSTTDLVEYIETHRYEVRWSCPGCNTLMGFEVTAPAARFGLKNNCRHVIVQSVAMEEHSGGPPIDEDTLIDFWESWQPKPDESPDAVYARLWEELADVRLQIQKENQ
jgi:hypothetical protein